VDHPLKNTPPSIHAIARNLLSTSPGLEPFVPYSQQNALYALKLLGTLAELTQNNLIQIELEIKPQPIAKSHPSEQPHLLSASQKPQPLPPWTDHSILEALLELRKSGKVTRKNPGIFSSILRAPSPSTPL